MPDGCAPVGERAAQPAYVMCGALARIASPDRVLRCRLVPTNSTVPPFDGIRGSNIGGVQCGDGLLQIDDVDAVALGEDERLHLRIPALGTVTEVHARLSSAFIESTAWLRYPPVKSFVSLPPSTRAGPEGCKSGTVPAIRRHSRLTPRRGGAAEIYQRDGELAMAALNLGSRREPDRG